MTKWTDFRVGEFILVPQSQGVENSRQNFVNSYDLLAELLDDEVLRILLLLNGHDQMELGELRASIDQRLGNDLRTSLRRLEVLSLVEESAAGWRASWLGAGVANWYLQRLYCLSEKFLPGPEEGENGRDLSLHCARYRPVFCRPGICWCGRIRMDHGFELGNLVELWLHTELMRQRDR